MQLFTEFIKSDLTEDQILPVLRELLPVLLSILGSTEVHTPLYIMHLTLNPDACRHRMVATHPSHPCPHGFCIPTVCDRTVYGKRSTPTGCEGSDCFCSPCVARGLQSTP
jgi:hypothetical protein